VPRRIADERRHAGRWPRHDERRRGASVAVLVLDFFITRLMITLFY
jgi:hypothetical protein